MYIFSNHYLLKAGRKCWTSSNSSPRVQQLSGFFLYTKYNARNGEDEAVQHNKMYIKNNMVPPIILYQHNWRFKELMCEGAECKKFVPDMFSYDVGS